jgi:hypothetical protein
MLSILVVGATRGLGAELVKQYHSDHSSTVFATTRSGSAPEGFPEGINWVTNVDLTKPNVGDALTTQIEVQKPLDAVVGFDPSFRTKLCCETHHDSRSSPPDDLSPRTSRRGKVRTGTRRSTCTLRAQLLPCSSFTD